MTRSERNDAAGILLLFGGIGLACLANRSPQRPTPPPAPRWAGLPTDWINLVAASQQSSMSCWAACIEMILKYWGVPITQNDIIRRVKGAPIDAPGTDDEISACLNASALDATGRRVRIQCRMAFGPMPLPMLIKELEENRPVLFVCNTGADVSHAVTISGLEYIPGRQGPWPTRLAYRDPNPSPENMLRRGRVELVGDEEIRGFLSSVQRHWRVAIS